MSRYTPLAKLLHYLALDRPFVAQAAFDLERALYLKATAENSDARHIFISGLARSGTTVLLRALHASQQFSCLTYANLPFALSPNTWSQFGGRFVERGPARERAHGDGLLVDHRSPEAFDEIYWRSFCGRAYIGRTELLPHRPSADVLSGFVDYVRLVAHSQGKGRYLSKNNNNLLRLSSLHGLFPNAIFLVPIRQPHAHAASLWGQHRRFAAADGFTRRYMHWLGHYEFGPGLRPFALAATKPARRSFSELEGWLEYWLDCHRYIRQLHRKLGARLVLVPHERLSGDRTFWRRLCHRLDLTHASADEFSVMQRRPPPVAEPGLLDEASALYHELCDLAEADVPEVRVSA